MYTNYLSYLAKYEYSIRSILPNTEIVKSYVANHHGTPIERIKLDLHVEPFSANRSGGVLSASFRFNVAILASYRTPSSAISSAVEFGPLILLPKTSLNEEDSLIVILHDVCGIEIRSPEPRWVSTFVAPKQPEIDEQIARIRSEIQLKQEELTIKESERQESRKPLRLLFAQHNDLEEAVRAAFSEIGSVVTLPEKTNKEDGWLTFQVDGNEVKSVLEIKGTERDDFDERGLRQLREWVGNGIERGEMLKGIFIGNSAVNSPPKERPSAFGANFVRNAKAQGFALITSVDLYTIYQLKVDGKLDEIQFWRDIFATIGVFDSGAYAALLVSTDEQ